MHQNPSPPPPQLTTHKSTLPFLLYESPKSELASYFFDRSSTRFVSKLHFGRERKRNEQGKLASAMISTLGSAYGRSGYCNKAIKVFDSMKDYGLKPNLVTYNVVIDACGKMVKKGCWQQANAFRWLSWNFYVAIHALAIVDTSRDHVLRPPVA
ncbi:unnamed protein product [Dovyalis caffra]|uniref:Pentatricopeptide repeat-containing protein n=1 Tax=Dovyalis caffra TaxID=77055 RepID=A0AAV1R3K9_9ROSI|nr:unnamed protein product [Dovyalis caffra]